MTARVRSLLARLSPEHATFLAACVLLIVGVQAPTSRYLSPESGVGYALGIVGGSVMLLLLLYPARKRIRLLSVIGGVPQWFRIHMILGVVGPVCILFHAGFSLGATNSNVALVCMLIVAGSGIVGRYFYSRIHLGLFGRKASLGELQDAAQVLKAQNPALPMVPDLIARIELEEGRLLANKGLTGMMLIAPFVVALRVAGAKRRLRRYVMPALKDAARRSSTVAAQRDRVERVVMHYVSRRLTATRSVAELRVYERLFALWHVLHLPLFFMLLAAGIVHVIAVHIY
jgi:hypothetical protein